MAPPTRNRRPLPRRVYWFRRLLFLGVVGGVAAALVLGIGRLLDYSGGGFGSTQATQVASSPEPSDAQRELTGQRRKKSGPDRSRGRDEKKRETLAEPDGPCEDGDVLVTPTIGTAHAGSPVRIVLEVTTKEADACYWEVSADSVFVNIQSADGKVWSSQECPGAVPTESVVPRRERPAKVAMWWDGKRSEEGCPAWREWVHVEGSYTAVAAARGSVTPVATGFYLGGAVAPTITRTPTPTPTETPSDDTERERTRDRQRPSGATSTPRHGESPGARPDGEPEDGDGR